MQAMGRREPEGGAWRAVSPVDGLKAAFLFRLQLTHTTSTGDSAAVSPAETAF